MGKEIRNIVAHEFLHIVTPLAIHAQQINDFDFYSPEHVQAPLALRRGH